jgi:hypothetical protein
MHMRISRYRPAPGADMNAVARRVREGLVPIFQRQPGFRGYWAIAEEDGSGTGMSVFDDRNALNAAIVHTRAWTKDVLHDLLPDPPEVVQCAVRTSETAGMDEATAWRQAAWCVLIEREKAAPSDAVIPLFHKHVLPALRAQPGFLAHLGGRAEQDEGRLVTVQFWDGREAAERGAEAVQRVTAEHLKDTVPAPTRHVLGRILVSAVP